MSFGDPNNPYGQQPQGQPGYGYPQQAPQGYPQQGGYAYPQQPQQGGYAYPAGPGGYPGMPMQMPGLLKTARVFLYIIAGLQLIVGVFALLGAAFLSSSDSLGSSSSGDAAAGVIAAIALVSIALAVWAIVLAAKFAKGGNGVRITTIVYSVLFILSSLGNFANLAGSEASPGSMVGGVVGLAIGVLVLVAAVNKDSVAWFNRPRY
ncbi:hypothetical protein ACFVGY_25405 [Streptomyces sp. NPDC127106]|uniref:hypothetical protein n=1 Tax=Streptomyces sp. NPDC127106 TaxID=3345360 RepID=UPI003644A91B